MMDNRIIRKPELKKLIPLSGVTIWRMEKKGQFPKRISLGGNSVGWVAGEVDDWIDKRMKQRFTKQK